jgi:succinate dehydrogenase / fumarate reductase iron-sulfur subunit
MSTERTLRVRRGTPDNAYYDTFSVPVGRRTTILDALEFIRARHDSSLLYRHSCHHGSCGTCGVIVNGERRLACLAPVEEPAANSDGGTDDAGREDDAGGERGEGSEAAGAASAADRADIVVEPLDVFGHLRDLAVDPTGFFGRYPEGATYVRESEVNNDAPVAAEARRDGTREGYERFENCIECGLCVSVCPVTDAFVGPATLAAFHRELKNRPERREEILGLVDQRDGVWACQRALNCSRVCPTKVYPAKHIAMLQREIEKGG